MKLYDVTSAPNPRRVRVFIAEKAMDVELEQVNMFTGEHKTPEFLAKNPSGKLPVLELDNGTCIAESVAICRYLEAVQPEPNLMGATPEELGLIEAVGRQLEFQLLGPIGAAWRNGPVVGRLLPDLEQIPAAKAQGETAARLFYQRLNDQLANDEFLVAGRFTIADITALCVIDFATNLVELRPGDELTAIWRWHAAVTARPSSSA